MTSQRFRVGKRAWWLAGLLLLVALAWFLFRQQIDEALTALLLLRSPSPSEEVFDQLTGQLPNPTGFLERCWSTGKVPHRQLVATFLRDQALPGPPWFAGAQKLLWAGTMDPDMSVRELALATLQSRDDSRLFDCARGQLSDPDPLVRQLGLDYLRRFEPQQGVPIVVGLLDDPDVRVVASAEVALMHWTGQDFGIRNLLAIPSHAAGDQLDPANAEKIRQGIERRKQWWQAHANDFPVPSVVPLPLAQSMLSASLVEDFTLPDLEGRPVHLAQFRGKTVLLNFWATWCTACLAEIPDLIALKREIGDRVVILGISLDGLVDVHGHRPSEEGEGRPKSADQFQKNLLTKVSRVAKARGINYPVLLDSENEVGRRFNGGELPTTVIIDPEGRFRRRFVGQRGVQVFQAMLAELGRRDTN